MVDLYYMIVQNIYFYENTTSFYSKLITYHSPSLNISENLYDVNHLLY